MKVDYVLPAFQPGVANDLPDSRGIVPSFREQVRLSRVPMARGWEQQLRLDARPFTATYIGPPPRPHTLALDNLQTERTRWRSLVSRHSEIEDAPHRSETCTSTPAVRTMIEMLRQMQLMEDSIVAQQVAVTRG